MGVLFPSEDRLPMYPRTGLAPEVPAGTVRPWGVRRMEPHRARGEAAGPRVVRVDLDPVTQTAVCYDADGHVLDTGRHSRTYQGTERSTATEGSRGDGQHGDPDTDFAQDSNPVD
ncbi:MULTISPECIES: putative ATP-grasp-modified RiPP [unclassified Frankia]|uniref:putative ATP-grasp-modified RiPP n=1 Tax=unclassified Frankia TaxID=2632575 RepID=UPI001EF680E7|nr:MULTISPECIES: putative ATP-grasp-modified RiPP [unclassified Frankia]